jgi:hypothetical protein
MVDKILKVCFRENWGSISVKFLLGYKMCDCVLQRYFVTVLLTHTTAKQDVNIGCLVESYRACRWFIKALYFLFLTDHRVSTTSLLKFVVHCQSSKFINLLKPSGNFTYHQV